MEVVLIFGSNEGNRYSLINNAIELTRQKIGEICKASSIYQTQAWGFKSDCAFLNVVVVYNTELSPLTILEKCLETEKILGRRRPNNPKERYSSRTMDIDILFLGNQTINTEELTVPHPRITERRFELVPLSEIMPNFIHPTFNKTISELLNECKDDCRVELYKPICNEQYPHLLH